MSSIGTILGCILVVIFLGKVIGIEEVFSDPCRGDGSPRETNNYYYADEDDEEEDE
jgi:hypothetical protein